jgi:hypothetical protein
MTKQEIHAQRAAALLILLAKMRAGVKVAA